MGVSTPVTFSFNWRIFFPNETSSLGTGIPRHWIGGKGNYAGQIWIDVIGIDSTRLNTGLCLF